MDDNFKPFEPTIERMPEDVPAYVVFLEDIPYFSVLVTDKLELFYDMETRKRIIGARIWDGPSAER